MEVNCKNILENNEDLTIHGESQIFNIETGETFTLKNEDYEKPIKIVYGKFQIISVRK